jgi:putative MATE family efflux protein
VVTSVNEINAELTNRLLGDLLGRMRKLALLLCSAHLFCGCRSVRPALATLQRPPTLPAMTSLSMAMTPQPPPPPPQWLSKLDREFISIGAPALVGLAIDPLASLVDTAMIGRYCAPADLAGAGVAIGAFLLVSRTFNFLSSATTSQVAGLAPADLKAGEFNEDMARGVAAALIVAISVGALLALTMSAGGGGLLSLLGINPASEVRAPARAYLAARALAYPATLSLMALEGAFRGARDTRTPLGALTLASALNVLLDAILIIGFRWGVMGAAAATSASQYVAMVVLWRRLLRSCGDACASVPPQERILGFPRPRLADCLRVCRAGSWLTIRTLSGSIALAYSSVVASTLGVVQGAAHQICYQLWFATSLLADAIAIAANPLSAAAIGRRDAPTLRAVCTRTARLALTGGVVLTVAMGAFGRGLCHLFTSDPAVLAAAAVVWPIVVLTLPANALAFALDGLLFGASDFRFTAIMQTCAAAVAMLCMLAAPSFGPSLGLRAVWFGLGGYMAVRVVLGGARIASSHGPWTLLKNLTDVPSPRARS